MSDTQTLDIHPEFSKMLPTQTAFELGQLEDSLKSEGRALQPLIVWKDGDKRYLVDGHTRYSICQKLKLPFDVVERNFGSKREIRLYIFQQQFARRNLSDAALSIGHDTYLTMLKGPARAKAQALAQPAPNVVAAAAKDLGISKATMKRDSRVAKGVKKVKAKDPKLADKIVSGDTQVSKKTLAAVGQGKATVKAVVVEASQPTGLSKAQQEAQDKKTKARKAAQDKVTAAKLKADAARLARFDQLEVIAEKLSLFFTSETPAGRRKLIGDVAETLGEAEGKTFATPPEYMIDTKAEAVAEDAPVKAKPKSKRTVSAADVAATFDG